MNSGSETEEEPFVGTNSDIDPNFEATLTSENSEQDEINEPNLTNRKGKKRLRSENQWERNIRKKRRTAGEQYINTNKATVSEKRMGNPCNCKKDCFGRVSAATRTKVFEAFYKLPSKVVQDSYLTGNIVIKKVSRHRKRREQNNRPKSVYCEFQVSNISNTIDLDFNSFLFGSD